MQNFIVDGGGNITIAPTVFTSLLTVNNTNQVTFNQPLNLGTNGQVIYKANGTLVVNGVTGTVITNAPDQGTLTINSGNVTGPIGDATNSLLAVNINGNGNITFSDIIKAKTITINNAAANVVVAGLITGTLNYNADATLFAQDGISGGVNFNKNGGNFSVYSNAGQTLTANFDNLDVGGTYGSVTISHNGDGTGTAATINGTVGGTNPIANFNIINGNEFSTNIVLNGAINATNILFKCDVDQNPNFTIAINNNITGAIQNVSNGTNNFVLNIADGKKITGTIDSQNVLSTIINLAGNNEITGAITNATTINFNGANIKLDSTVNSTNFVVANDGASAIVTGLMTGDLGYNAGNSSVTATGGLTGNVNYNDNNGTFTLGDGSKLTGTVSNGNNATVIALGNGSITGAITDLNTLEFSGVAGTNLNLSDTVNTSINSNITNITYTDSPAASGTINVNTGLTAGTVTFNASNANGGTIIINAPSTIGLVANAANGTIVVNADFIIQDPNAGNIDEIRIKDKTTYTIDSVNAVSGNIDLLANNRKIIFEGVDSQLALVNSSNTDARTFTLNNNLNPSSTQDGYGIVRVSTAGQDLTITNNGGPFTIGQDNTHRLQNFIVSTIGTPVNPGSITIDNIVFTKLLSMNSLGIVTLNEALDLGAGGTIAFGANGTLIVNGITGSVTTSKNGQGTLTINSGNVTGTIGDATNSLLAVNIRANLVTFLANVFAPVLLTDQNSALTLADNVTVTGSVKTSNDGKGVLTLGANSSVTGGIGEANAKLAQVKVGAGDSNLGGGIYSELVTLTDNTSALTLLNGINFDGSITNEATAGNGKLIFEQDGTITGGITGNSLAEIVFNGIDTIGGNVNATTLTVNAGANATIAKDTIGSAVYAGAGALTSTGNFTGGIDFKGKDGTFYLGAGKTLTGSAISTGGRSGTFVFVGDGTVTQNLGINGAGLTEIVFNGADEVQGGVDATTLTS